MTDTLDWRLQAFDLMSEYSEERPPEALVSHAYMIAEQFKPEEVRKGAFEMLKQAPPWCVALELRSSSSHQLTCSRVQGRGRVGCWVPGAGGLCGTQADADRGAARHPAGAHGVSCSGE